jgi:hypothetical protein
MKTIKQITLLFIFIVVSSCSKNNDDTSQTVAKIDGQWKLKYVNGSITGASYYFEPGVVNWLFNPMNNTVTVVNNNTNNNLNAVFPSGTYTYEISSNPEVSCNQTIKIDGTEFGCLDITTNELNIDQTFADGFQVHLVR